jgi:hypothetical protein
MFYKTITKNFAFVISLAFLCGLSAGCSFVHSNGQKTNHRNQKQFSDRFDKPKVLGKIESKEIKESSGLTASRCNVDIFWTHNDAGNKNHIYAINKSGEKLGTYEVAGAENEDWEDIASRQDENGACFLYIGDIGNNDLDRNELSVYRVEEPKVAAAHRASDKKDPVMTKTAEAFRFSYPGATQNAETLLIHPETADIYVLTKRTAGASGVFKLSGYKPGQTAKLVEIGKVSLPAIPNGLLTGGEISPDGSRIVLCDYYNGYEIVLPKNEKNFDAIWKDEPSIIELGTREQGEAICYSLDGAAVYATSEKKNSPFIEVKRIGK